MRVWLSFFLLLIVIMALIVVPITTANPVQQVPEVFAEAVGTANVRSGPSTEFDIVGEISAGTEYRILAQYELAPWYLLEMPALATRAGWVYADLVKITRGDLATVRIETKYEELPVLGAAVAPSPTVATAPTSTVITGGIAAPSVPVSSPEFIPSPTVTLAPTLAPPVNLVTVTLQGRSNIRFGPGIEYPSIMMLDAGATMTVIAWHSNFPWLKVAVEGAPNGEGWIFVAEDQSNVAVQGDIYSLPVISDLNIAFPTPSATPNTVMSSNSPWSDFGNADSTALTAGLGSVIDNYLLSQPLRVAPRTDREASVFVLDLRSGQHFTLNGGVAYSGMSINKVPILVRYFLHLDTPLDQTRATLIANTMICSENITTNQMITEIGDGDILEGAARVTEMLSELGLGNTYMVAPFATGEANATPAPVSPVTTQADQIRTQPDQFNQLTVEDIGWLLGSMYQCAADGTGPLVSTFPNQVNQTECRQMIRAMSGNHIGALIEAGVQPGTTVAHKHGWIADTHGNAGIVIGAESTYVLAMVYHERTTWLNYEQSFPVLEEISRLTWNYFNPNSQITQTFSSPVPETCNIFAEPVIPDMLNGVLTLPGIQP